MLERTIFVRDVNKNHDISIPSNLNSSFRSGDHYRVYFDIETGAIAYVPNNYPTEEKFMRNLTPTANNEPKRNKYILRHDFCDEVYLSLTNEQVNLFEWLKNQQVVDTEYELIPINENINWLNI